MIAVPKTSYDFSALSDEQLLALAHSDKLVADRRAHEELLALYPHAGFTPHGGQEDAIRMFAEALEQRVMTMLLACGNGWGKSYLLANLLWNIVCPPEQRNQWFRLPVIEQWPFPKHLRILSNAKQLKEPTGELWKAINHWWPKDFYTATKQGYDYNSVYQIRRTGFLVDVMTYDQPSDMHESATLGGVFADEPPPQHIWSVYPSRFRHGGFIAIFATLVYESGWIQEAIIENPACRVRFGDIEENCQLHGKRGTLVHQNIETMVANFPPHEREARRSGKPVHLRGRAFDIEPTVHCVDDIDPEEAAERGTTYLILDPHDRRPWAIAIGLVDRNGDHVVVEEWPEVGGEWDTYYQQIDRDTRGIDDYADLLRRLEQKWSVDTMVIDSKFANQQKRESAFAVSLRRKLETEHGFSFEDGNVNVHQPGGGVQFLHEYLDYDRTRPVDFSNKPKFFYCRRCRNVGYQLTNITWREFKDPERYGERQVLDDRLLDFPRLCMYFVMHDAEYKNPGRTPPALVSAQESLRRSLEKEDSAAASRLLPIE